MSWKFFIVTNLITRPIGILCTCFLSSGIIPFAGWWIVLWVVLAIACLVLFILCYKFQPQIENFIYKLSHKLQHKEKVKHIEDKETVAKETILKELKECKRMISNQIETISKKE